LYEHVLVLIEQNSVRITAICGVSCVHSYRGKVRACTECPVSDVGDAVWNRYAGHAAAAPERKACDTGNRKTVDFIGDGYSATRIAVSGDGDLVVRSGVGKYDVCQCCRSSRYFSCHIRKGSSICIAVLRKGGAGQGQRPRGGGLVASNVAKYPCNSRRAYLPLHGGRWISSSRRRECNSRA